MRRSICYCEPAYAYAGEMNTWKFIYTPSAPLPKGTRLKFDLQSKGRQIDWEIPSSNLKDSGPYIYATMGKDKILPATEIETPDMFAPQYEFVLPAALAAGSSLTIVLGAKENDHSKQAPKLRAQTLSQRRRPFFLYIDPSGKRNYGDPKSSPWIFAEGNSLIFASLALLMSLKINASMWSSVLKTNIAI